MAQRDDATADDFPLALRGVYCQPYLVRGCREWVAIDSRGEHIAVRHVRPGRKATGAIADLWDELRELDPIAPHDESPSLRLIR